MSCTQCGELIIKHKTLSLCKKCYHKYWWNTYKDKYKEQRKNNMLKYQDKNRLKLKHRDHERYESNKEQILSIRKTKRTFYNELEKIKYKTDVNFKLKTVLRKRLYHALKKQWKSGSAVSDLGCSIEYLRTYLESKFHNNLKTNEIMSWDNYGKYGWHIDHIKPLSSFDLTDPEQLREACNYKNLQPLWAEDNLRKSDIYE